MRATLSVIGLYEMDPTLFDGMKLPDSVNLTILKDNILYNCAELEVLYPDPDFMKMAIASWSRAEYNIFSKLAATLDLDYNPIWNVDANIFESETGARNKNGSFSETDSDSRQGVNNLTSGATKINTGTDSDSGSDTSSKAGYNSASLYTYEKLDKANTKTLNLNETNSGNESGSYSDEGSATRGGTNSENENNNVSRSTRRTGNIGVTTTQQMIKEERDVAQFSIYDYITDAFQKRFCLLVY